MDGLDLRKLIKTFLAASAGISLVVLVASNFLASSQTNPSADTSANYSNAAKTSAPNPVENGFLTLLGQNPDPGKSGNYTENLANGLAQKVLNQNPEGPQLDDAGSLGFSVPSDVSGLASVAGSGKDLSRALTPDVDKSRIKKLAVFSAADVDSYFSSLQGATDSVNSSAVDAILGIAPSEDSFSSLYLINREMEERLLAVPVPAPLFDLHVATLELVDTQNKFLLAVKDDPVKAALLWKTSQSAYVKQINKLQQIIDKLRATGIAIPDNRHGIASLLGVSTAYATIPAFDYAAWFQRLMAWFQKLKEWYKQLEDWYDKYAKEWLKNTILGVFTRAAIDYATGHGSDPNFVTNWKNYLGQAFNQAAGGAIGQLVPQLCTGFGPLLQIELKAAYYDVPPPPGYGSGCTLDRIGYNLQNFYSDFQNGNWVAFSLTTLPSGNYYGSLFFNTQEVANTARAAEEAAKNKAQAGAGYKGTDKPRCDEGQPDASGNCTVTGTGTTSTSTTPAEQDTTTPGSNIGSIVSGALTSPVQRISSAQTFDALVAYLVQTVALKLFSSGKDGLLANNITNDSNASPDAACQQYPAGSPEHENCVNNLTNPTATTTLPSFPLRPDDINPTIPECTFDPNNPDTPPVCNVGGICKATPDPIVSTGGARGAPVDFREPGDFFSPTPDKPFYIKNLVSDNGQNYSKVTLDMDVTVGDWSPEKPDGVHNLFWLQRGQDIEHFGWHRNVLGYANLLGPNENNMRLGTSLNLEFGDRCAALLQNNKHAVVEKGTKYHVSYTYDTIAHHVELKLTNSATGEVTSQIVDDVTANVLNSTPPPPLDHAGNHGFFLDIGLDGKTGGEQPTYGWQYSDLHVVFTPADPGSAPTPTGPMPRIDPPSGAAFASTPATLDSPGLFFGVPAQNQTGAPFSKMMDMPAEVGKNYKKLTVDFDAHAANFSPVFTNIFAATRPHVDRSTLATSRGYAGFFVNMNNSSSRGVRTQIDTLDNVATNVPANWQENANYHVNYVYDTVVGTVTINVTNKDTGASIGTATANISNFDLRALDPSKTISLSFSQDGVADEAYYPSYGWSYSNLHAVLQ